MAFGKGRSQRQEKLTQGQRKQSTNVREMRM